MSRLLRAVRGRATEAEQHYLRVHVRNLRQKPEPDRPRLLVTEPRVGYRLPGRSRTLSGQPVAAARWAPRLRAGS